MSAPPSEYVLKVQGISKSFGGLQALQNVDMHVKPGEFHAIIGPNGAGKSTFFNTLTGLLKADEGSIWFDGRNVSGFAPHTLTRLGMGRTFQITRVFHGMTVLENVQMALCAHALQSWQCWTAAAIAADTHMAARGASTNIQVTSKPLRLKKIAAAYAPTPKKAA